jgi:hypothetical protein
VHASTHALRIGFTPHSASIAFVHGHTIKQRRALFFGMGRNQPRMVPWRFLALFFAWLLMAHTHCTLDDVILHRTNCSPPLLCAWCPNFCYAPNSETNYMSASHMSKSQSSLVTSTLHVMTIDFTTHASTCMLIISPFDLLHDLLKVYIP